MNKVNYIDTRKLMGESKFYEGYSRWNEHTRRYETWEEAVDRVMDMHRTYYKDKMCPELESFFNEATQAYKSKLVAGAQRALQFGGDQLLKTHMKMYNCTASYCNRPEFFGEAFYILLCGAGVGFSVQKHHINMLPKIAERKKSPKTHIIEDSIEGWATALDVLMSSYFVGGGKHPEFEGKRVYFDLSQIRPKGAKISGGFLAPGPEPLRKSLDKIEYLIQGLILSGKNKLEPIHCYDIIMHASDAVLAGGVRRSATICLFSHDDNDMLTAKTGNWTKTNPQRARSNNSAVILRDEITKEQFSEIMKSVKEFGEPGFYFVNDKEILTNPCVSGKTILKVKDHDIIQNGEMIAIGTEYEITMEEYVSNFSAGSLNPLVLSYNFETKQNEYMIVTAAELTRHSANVIKISTDDGKELILTPDHKVFTKNRGWIEAKELTENDDIITL